jgi:hypothetical protein
VEGYGKEMSELLRTSIELASERPAKTKKMPKAVQREIAKRLENVVSDAETVCMGMVSRISELTSEELDELFRRVFEIEGQDDGEPPAG